MWLQYLETTELRSVPPRQERISKTRDSAMLAT